MLDELGIIMIGWASQNGLHPVIDRLVVFPVNPTFIGSVFPEQLHDGFIGLWGENLERIVGKPQVTVQ
ncbi:MAG: hypothetical protein M3132_05215 [Actinomycetia bacterium]|nr:hypothetical protein [Actinomycetes bacterium]